VPCGILPALSPRSATPYTWPTRSAARRHANDRPAEVLPIVVVRVVDAGSEFELQVEDTGVGIPAAALPTIFDPYRQAHRNRGGSGLGLAIVQGVAKAHGGHVTAESREGKGSRFTVLLPRS
jgi:signal transduction histidine kinase